MGGFSELKDQVETQGFIAKKNLAKDVSVEENIKILNETTNLQGAFIFLLLALYFDLKYPGHWLMPWVIIVGGLQVFAGIISFARATFRVWAK